MKKKLIFVFSVCLTLLLSSCEDDNYAPNLHVQILAGQWVVTTPEFFIDYYGLDDTWTLITSNTNDNSNNALLLTDASTFWDFTVTVPAEPWVPLFGDITPVDNLSYDEKIVIRNGTVTPKAVTLPSGWVADKIAFYIGFEDGNGSFDEFRIVGYRVSGFLEDIGYVYYEE
ncbi:MAG: hypothetical protein LBE13_16815 [Bacteroidales bacterium]|jgi:hypothetical protein|nr:hypothetical protein [Bacteroidales bacterium]